MAYSRYRTGLVEANPGAKKKWNGYTGKKGPEIVRGSAYKPILVPSDQQVAICDAVAHGTGNLMCVSRAGVGKTATIIEAMRGIQNGKSVAYFIFNKRNQEEALSKTDERISCLTTHAFGLAAIKKAFGKIEVDAKGDKSYNISIALLGPEDEKAEVRYHFGKAMDLAKSYLCTEVSQVIDVCDKHAIEMGDMKPEEFGVKVLEGMELSARQYMRVEFSDMVWLPVKLNLTIPQFDYVFLDEAQDTAPCRLELVLRSVKPDGRFISVLDPAQAIYGWAGADEKSCETIKERTSPTILPLTKTFRCAKAIVRLAQTYVPDYEAADQNPEGVVADRTLEQMLKAPEDGGVAPSDFVISRTNAPLVKMCLALIVQGRKAYVLGKDLGKSLSWMVKRSKAESVVGFLSWLEDWKNTEVDKLTQRNKPADHITDKFDCLVALCEGQRTLDGLKAHIEDMFSDNDEAGKVCFQTAHRSKGREARRCWVLMYTYKCEGDQEDNVLYVSFTRAIHDLYLVSDK